MKFYFAAALDDLETVLSEEKPFCIMITWAEKYPSTNRVSALHRSPWGADKSIE